MTSQVFRSKDEIRSRFSSAMSAMYRTEVPQYGTLLELVAQINAELGARDPSLANERDNGRLAIERHGAIRLGTPEELFTMRRLFSVMGMVPVGYYDLSSAGVPVHSTAFRPIQAPSLAANPFRVFTSLLRPELIADASLREQAISILKGRKIFTERCLELIALAEAQGGLNLEDADEFVSEALETFRWHSDTTVDIETYRRLRACHPLLADIVCFRGPHINHLTPRVLDIDRAQQGMSERGIRAKDWIEGPPRRRCPILLRQTSFLALEEPVRFKGGREADGTHTARFGEIEQRGYALTRKGRALYDELLAASMASEKNGTPRAEAQQAAFAAFPDDTDVLFREKLVHFTFSIDQERFQASEPPAAADIDALVAGGWVIAEPQIYEDFLPVSAAGIFRSNLGKEARDEYSAASNKEGFEKALGAKVQDEFALYEQTELISQQEALLSIHRLREASAA